MTSPLIDLQPDDLFRGPLLLVDVQERETRTGSTFLDLKLRDRSAELPAKKWKSTPEDLAAIQGATFVEVVARVEAFQGRNQLRVEAIAPCEPSPEALQQLIRASAWESEVLWREIRAHLRHEIQEEPLWRLVESALEDDDVRTRAKTIAAASVNHHAYRSGLAEHILSMMRLGAQLARHYAAYYPIPLHRGIIAAGIFFHDLGKIWELEGDIKAGYTTEGRLLGHIFMAASWIGALGERVGAPRELVVELQHIVLSHHGQLEFGSPKRPNTLEAMLIHHVDKLDADMNHWMHELEHTTHWTPWVRNYGRPLYRADHARTEWDHTQPTPRDTRGPGLAVDTLPSPQEDVRQATDQQPRQNRAPNSATIEKNDNSSYSEFHENYQIENENKTASKTEDIREDTLSLFDGIPYTTNK